MTLRAVLDANIYVSALIQRGSSHRILQAWLRDQAFVLIVSRAVLDEVEDVLARPRLAKRVAPEASSAFVAQLRTLADLVVDPSDVRAETRDPDDDYLVALARAHRADVIVSGDKDLLEWSTQSPVVLNPAAFEAMLNRRSR